MINRHDVLGYVVRALCFVILISTAILTYHTVYGSLSFKIENKRAQNEARLKEQDSTDPLQLIQARGLKKW